MTTDNKDKRVPQKKKVVQPMSLACHKRQRALDILKYASESLDANEKIDKAFLKELGEIA